MSYGLGTHNDNTETGVDNVPPPRPGMYLAVLLELSMLGTFAVNHSIVGALLWAAYFYFSATCALFFWKAKP